MHFVTGFALANAGYDVWLGNSRGNKYSLEHERLNYAIDPEFWDFCMDELIELDTPAMIEYILGVTRQRSLGFIGISQGNTLMFGLLASQDRYNQVVKPFISLAPVLSTHNVAGNIPLCAKKLLLNTLTSSVLM